MIIIKDLVLALIDGLFNGTLDDRHSWINGDWISCRIVFRWLNGCSFMRLSIDDEDFVVFYDMRVVIIVLAFDCLKSVGSLLYIHFKMKKIRIRYL